MYELSVPFALFCVYSLHVSSPLSPIGYTVHLYILEYAPDQSRIMKSCKDKYHLETRMIEYVLFLFTAILIKCRYKVSRRQDYLDFGYKIDKTRTTDGQPDSSIHPL